MDDKNQDQNTVGQWWKPAVEIFSEVSAWILVPIIFALAVGKGLDKYFNTTPWIFIICALLGFIFSIFKITKIVRKYADNLKDK